MRINNKSISGIFYYSDDIIFEKNDFVVFEDCIYICLNQISGVNPSEDLQNEYYRPYPGSKILTADEFFDYVESGEELEDKYVSSRALLGIIKRYQFGMGMTGVVEDYIDESCNTSLDMTLSSDRPLDDIMLNKDLNNGVLLVSPKLSQIKDLTIDDTTDASTIFGYLDKDGEDYNLLLRQYTYQYNIERMARVQELVSPLSGIQVYRFITWATNQAYKLSTDDVISGWRTTNVDLTYENLKTRLDTVTTFLDNINRSHGNDNSVRYHKIDFSDDLFFEPDTTYQITAKNTSSEISDSMIFNTSNPGRFYFSNGNDYINVSSNSSTAVSYSNIKSLTIYNGQSTVEPANMEIGNTYRFHSELPNTNTNWTHTFLFTSNESVGFYGGNSILKSPVGNIGNIGIWIFGFSGEVVNLSRLYDVGKNEYSITDHRGWSGFSIDVKYTITFLIGTSTTKVIEKEFTYQDNIDYRNGFSIDGTNYTYHIEDLGNEIQFDINNNAVIKSIEETLLIGTYDSNRFIPLTVDDLGAEYKFGFSCSAIDTDIKINNNISEYSILKNIDQKLSVPTITVTVGGESITISNSIDRNSVILYKIS